MLQCKIGDYLVCHIVNQIRANRKQMMQTAGRWFWGGFGQKQLLGTGFPLKEMVPKGYSEVG